MQRLIFATLLLLPVGNAPAQGLGEDGYADSGGVKIHYETAGKGPLVVLIHGFPSLLDGGRVIAPNLAFYTEDGWRAENEGTPPDVEVEVEAWRRAVEQAEGLGRHPEAG